MHEWHANVILRAITMHFLHLVRHLMLFALSFSRIVLGVNVIEKKMLDDII